MKFLAKYKKQIKFLGAFLVTLFAIVGFSGSVLIANGSIGWNGATDYNQTLTNLNEIQIEVNRIKQETKKLEDDSKELIAEKQRLEDIYTSLPK